MQYREWKWHVFGGKKKTNYSFKYVKYSYLEKGLKRYSPLNTQITPVPQTLAADLRD